MPVRRQRGAPGAVRPAAAPHAWPNGGWGAISDTPTFAANLWAKRLQLLAYVISEPHDNLVDVRRE